MKKVLTSVAVVATMISVTGCGSRSRPIYNVNRHVMPLEAENLSDKQRSERIRLAAGKQKWSCRETSPQKLICQLRSKRDTSSIDIDHNKHYFSINYLDSSNLRHKKGKIHPIYNKRVMKLEKEIEKSIGLVQLSQSASNSGNGSLADTPVANASRYHHTKKTIIEETRASNSDGDSRNDRPPAYDSGQFDESNAARRAADAERSNQERLAKAQEHRKRLAREAKGLSDRLSSENAERDRLAREVSAQNKAERAQLETERANLESRRAAESARQANDATSNKSSVKEAPIGNVDHVELDW